MLTYNKINMLMTIIFAVFTAAGVAFSQTLQLGDGVRLTFYNISDAESGDFYVQQDGNIQLPYIGLVQVLSREFDALQAEILEKYSAIYRDPELTVQPLYKVNVLGEVKKPGIYYITGVEIFPDLMAMAGGETPDANLGKVVIIRNEQKIEIDANDVLQEGRRLEDIGLRSGDQIYVSRKKIIGFNNAAVLVSIAALVVTTIGVINNSKN